MQRLYLKGFFSDILVRAYPEDQDIRLVYETLPLIITEGYKIKGNAIFSDKEITGIVRPEKGEPLSEYLLKNSLERLARHFRDGGYFQAKIRHKIQHRQGGDKASVYLRIQEGSPSSILSLRIQGNAALARDFLLQEIRSREGKTYNPRVLESDLQRIRRLYLARKYLTARVARTVRFQEEKAGAEVEIEIHEGPRLNILLEGNRRVPSKKLLRQVRISSTGSYRPEVLEESKEAMIRLYQGRGYHFVEVGTPVIDPEAAGQVTVKFFIKEGPRVRVSRMDIAGNETIDTKTIREAISTRERGLFRAAIFQEKVWQEDREKVLSLYYRQGFLQARIAEKALQFSQDRRSVRISLRISEGEQTRIREISFQGNSSVATETLRQAIQSQVALPYHRDRAEEDRAEILAVYLTQGFLRASVEVKEDFFDRKASVRLGYVIEENRRTRLGDIFVWGNQKTRESIITREFQKGEFYNPELLLSARQKLLKLGVFEGIEIRPFRTRTVDGLWVQDLQVRVKEKPANQVTLGLGYDSDQELLSALRFTRANIQGLDRNLSLSGQLNTLQRGLSIDYHEPWLFNRPIDSSAGLYFKEEEDRESFTLETIGAKLSLSREIFPSTTGSLRYELERVRTKEVDPGAVLSSRDKGESHLAHIHLSLVRDTRDLPLDPSRGSVNDLGLKGFSSLWGSEADFLRIYGSSRWFLPLFKRHVLALSGQFGWIEKFRHTKEVPISERFFIGGAGTVRGFELNKIGPHGPDRSLVGGSSLVIGNLEGRFRLGDRLIGVLFVDMGNTWLENRDFLRSLRKSAGLGLRWKTPLGLLRLDWGFKLDPRKGEDLSRVHFSFGHAF